MDKIKEVCQIQVGEGFKARVDESGNILIEKEKFVPKDGDYMFYITSSNSPVISISKGVKDNKLMSYADFFIDNNNLFNSYGRTTVYTDYYDAMIDIRLATPEEKEKLDKKLEEIGLRFNSTTKVLEKIYQPQDGDIVHYITNDFEGIAIFKEICEDIFYRHCVVYKNEDDKTYSKNILMMGYTHHFSKFKEIRLATEEERNILFTNINAANKIWNSDLKILCTKPKVGDLCIFWNITTQYATIDLLKRFSPLICKSHRGGLNDNCIPYNEELYKKMID